MADIGVAHTSVEDVSAPGADIASPDDLFRLVADMHGTVGSLPTASALLPIARSEHTPVLAVVSEHKGRAQWIERRHAVGA